jgi:Uri superfamily endonuclease
MLSFLSDVMDLATSGVYVLKIFIDAPITFEIGHLGKINFQSGIYGYIGSALLGNKRCSGPPGPLLRRVQRHVKPANEKKMHWHIDYLLAHPNVQILSILLLSSLKREECDIAQLFKQYATASIPKFGCSDCQCASHLLYFGNSWDFRLINNPTNVY